jgi:DNA modification methylase
MSEVRIMAGHVLERLKELPDGSVHMCCTSPPYWGLRSYKTEPQVWGGLRPGRLRGWRQGKRTCRMWGCRGWGYEPGGPS